MTQVFISYKHDDSDFAALLKLQLEEASFEAWLDEERLRPGENWREGIDQAIRESLALIVVMTPEASQSEYVTYEWAFAWGAGVPVIPIMLKSTPLHPRLETLHYLDFTPHRAHPWDDLIKRLDEINQKTTPYDAPPAIRRAVEALDDPDPDVRKKALDSLAQSRHPAALEALVGATKHHTRDVRILASFHIAELKGYKTPAAAAAVPGLLEALQSSDFDVSQGATDALVNIGDTAVPGLIEALYGESEDVRATTADTLGEIGDRVAVPDLIETLKDADHIVRNIVVNALGEIGDPAAVPGLIETLKDTDHWVRENAAKALGRIGDPAAVSGLIEALADEASGVCCAAANALGRIGDSDAVPSLITIVGLKDENIEVRQAAVNALGRIGVSDAVPSLITIVGLKDENTEVRQAAASTLGWIGDPAAVPSLVETLKDTDRALRTTAANALGWIDDPAAVPGLIEALEDKDGDVRRASAAALVKIGGIAAMPGLIAALKVASRFIGKDVTDALVEIGDAAVPHLIEALRDDEDYVQNRAATALERIATPEALAAVKQWRNKRIHSRMS